MKKVLLLMIFLSNNLFASESIKLYVETSIYFVSNEGEKKIQDVAHMKKYYGGFNENHSSADEPGGEWNIETRLSESNVFNIKFWISDKGNPEINKDFDLSGLDMTTVSLFKTNKAS